MRATLGLLLALIALGAFVWFYELEGEAGREEAKEVEKRVFGALAADEVDWFALRTNDDREARVARHESGWRIESPLAFPADAVAADAVASALAGLTASEVYEEIETLESYGLDGEPRVRFGANDATHTLRLGNATPVGGGSYATNATGSRVFVLPTYRTNAFQKSFDELREARVFDFAADEVQAIEAEWPGGRVVLARSESGWRLSEPLETEADAEAVADLLSDVQYLRADGFVDAPPDEGTLGFGVPDYELELSVAEDRSITMTVGGEREGARRAVRGPRGFIYEIAQARVDALPRDPFALRAKALARFQASDAERLIFEWTAPDGETLQLAATRGEDGDWRSEPPLAAGTASRVLAQLSTLDGRALLAESLGPDEQAAVGLAPPRARIRVLAADEGALADVWFGAPDEAQGIPARREDRATIYWVDAALGSELPLALAAYRESFSATSEDAPAPASPGAPASAPPIDP